MRSERGLELDLRVAGIEPGRPRLELALRLEPGITTLVGPSGAGKSTCLLALAGLVRPERGRIVLGARTLFDSARKIDLPPRKRKVALLFQSLALFPHLSAAQNVAFALPRTTPRSARAELARSWLARMHVDALSERRPATLSGGEAQRVALARALASEPSLLLLDEPFSALDEALRVRLAREVAELVAELGIPALLVTHAYEEHSPVSQRLVRLCAGRMVPNEGQRTVEQV